MSQATDVWGKTAARSGDPKGSRLYEPIEASLQEVERRLQEELKSDHECVDVLTRYGWSMGGKRLRPALLLLTAQATGDIRPEHVTLATVVEMIHMATLVHDDVLDGAQVRRHMATINCRWSDQASILLGDYLFSHAFYLASTLESTYACRVIGRSTNRVCEGEIRQNDSSGNLDLSEAAYLSIIDAKTAELCACACHLGAHYAGADADMTIQLTRFGRLVGTAFQITDDVLDLTGRESQTGKSLGTDLAQKKPTLPLIHYWRSSDDAERRELIELLADGASTSRAAVVSLLQDRGSIQYAVDHATRLVDEAIGVAQRLEPSPAQRVLVAAAQQIVLRRS